MPSSFYKNEATEVKSKGSKGGKKGGESGASKGRENDYRLCVLCWSQGDTPDQVCVCVCAYVCMRALTNLTTTKTMMDSTSHCRTVAV